MEKSTWYKGGVARNAARQHLGLPNCLLEKVIDIDSMESLMWDSNVDQGSEDLIESFLTSRDCTLNECLLEVKPCGEEVLYFTEECEQSLFNGVVTVVEPTYRAICRAARFAARVGGSVALKFDLKEIKYCCDRCDDEPSHQYTKAFLEGLEEEYLLRLQQALPKAIYWEFYLFEWKEVERELARRNKEWAADMLFEQQESKYIFEVKTPKANKGLGRKPKTKK